MRTIFYCFLAVAVFSSNAFAGPTGKELYEKSCKTCHGIDGKGNSKLAQGMKIKPELLDLTKPATKSKKDDALKLAIADGIGKMKGLKEKLKPEETSLIVTHVRKLQEAVQ